MILLVGELIRNIFSQGKSLEFLPWMKHPILLLSVVGFEPMTSQSVVVSTPRLAHHQVWLKLNKFYITAAQVTEHKKTNKMDFV